MLNRFLFLIIIFFSILFSISQESIDIVNSVSDINLTSNENQFYIQTNNIGDPFLSLKPIFNDIDLSLTLLLHVHAVCRNMYGASSNSNTAPFLCECWRVICEVNDVGEGTGTSG